MNYVNLPVRERQVGDVPRDWSPTLRNGDHRRGQLQQQQLAHCRRRQHAAQRHHPSRLHQRCLYWVSGINLN